MSFQHGWQKSDRRAGLQALPLWVLGATSALLLVLERRTPHGLRLDLDISDAHSVLV